MKKIEAIIRASKLDDVKNELIKHDILGMTVSEAKGYGKQKGHSEVQTDNDSEYEVEFVPKVKIEIVISDYNIDRVIDIIRTQAYTGSYGDGKIFMYNVERVVRIRTNEQNSDAL